MIYKELLRICKYYGLTKEETLSAIYTEGIHNIDLETAYLIAMYAIVVSVILDIVNRINED